MKLYHIAKIILFCCRRIKKLKTDQPLHFLHCISKKKITKKSKETIT